jgi:hypothetical protein
VSQDNQTLRFHIAGLRGDQVYLRRDIERLRAEVDALRRAIGSCRSDTDCCGPFRDAFRRRAPHPADDTRNARDGDDGLDGSSSSLRHAEE